MRISDFEIKVVRFSSDDVIATSLYYAPAAAFYAATGINFASEYVQFEGTMVGYDSNAGGYYVANPRSAEAADSDNVAGLKSGGSVYLPDVGITIPSTAMAPIAQQAYDAYEYDNGLYTKGATYYEAYWQ